MLKTIVISAILTSSLFAADRVFVPNVGLSSVTFDLPYTAGIVKGVAEGPEGTLILDGENQLLSGRLVVALNAIKTGNPTRDCHLREAMGIDYKNSNFPAQHVCDNQNQTPPTGPNSVVFPTIEFEFSSLTLADGTKLPATLEEGKAHVVELKGRLTMHGQTKEAVLVGSLTETAGVLNLALNFPVRLADYGIVVKASLGTTIGAAATVKLKLALQKEASE